MTQMNADIKSKERRFAKPPRIGLFVKTLLLIRVN